MKIRTSPGFFARSMKNPSSIQLPINREVDISISSVGTPLVSEPMVSLNRGFLEWDNLLLVSGEENEGEQLVECLFECRSNYHIEFIFEEGELIGEDSFIVGRPLSLSITPKPVKNRYLVRLELFIVREN